MIKKLMAAFTVVSIIVLVFVVFWATYRTVRTRADNIDRSISSVRVFERGLLSGYLADGSFAGMTVADTVNQFVESNSSVKAFVLHDGSEPEYIYSRSASYIDFEQPESGNPDIPSFAYDNLRERLTMSKIVFPDNSVRVLSVLTTVLSRSDIFPIVREVLIILIAFLFFTSMYIVILPIVSARSSAVDSTQVRAGGADIADVETYIAHTPDGSAESAADIQDIDIEGDSVAAFASASESPVEPHSPSAGSGSSDAQVTTANPPRSASPGLYSPTSDLGWEDYLEERLNTELRRAASFDQDLVLILLTLAGVYRNTEKYRSFADRVREFFTFRDLCFEFGQSGIGVIVPNIDLDQGIEKYEDFRKAKSNENMASHLHAGISSRNGRLIEGKRLIREASGAVDKARSEKTGVVAFRVDPEKYRSYIASQA